MCTSYSFYQSAPRVIAAPMSLSLRTLRLLDTLLSLPLEHDLQFPAAYLIESTSHVIQHPAARPASRVYSNTSSTHPS